MKWFSILMLFIAVAGSLFLVGVKFSQAQTQRILCLDPKAHLIWPSPQSANTIPMRTAGTADTLTNSPLSVSGGNVAINTGLGVSGNVAATGNVSGANICVGASCVSNWSQVSGPWTQSGTNLYPTNTSTNVGLGRSDPQYKLDVNGTFRVTVNGEERLVIKETGSGGPGAQAPNQHNLAQVKPALAQTTTDRWMELFGGAVYFLKRGTNSDVFLRVGDANTTVGSVGVKGQSPRYTIYDENNNLMGATWYSKQTKSMVTQYYGGSNLPITQLELSKDGLKLWKGQTLLYEVTEE